MATILAALTVAVPWFGAPSRPAAINIRWAEAVGNEQRHEVEARFRLTGGELAEGRTWRYTLVDVSRANIQALVQHPSVEDTSNLDRSAFRPLVARFRLSPVAVAVFAALGAGVLLWLGNSVRGATFWSLCLFIPTAAVMAARMRPGIIGVFVGAWPMAVPVAGFVVATFTALRVRVPLSPRVAQWLLVLPPVALAAAAALVVVAAVFGVEPYMTDNPPVTLLEAVREGDRAMVYRLLEGGTVRLGASDTKDADRALLEAAVKAGEIQTLKLIVGAVGALDAPTRSHLVSLAQEANQDVLVAFLRTAP